MATTAFQGNPVRTIGELPATGSSAPGFELVGADLGPVSSRDFTGKRVVLNIFPSLDTDVCANTLREFNKRAASLENTMLVHTVNLYSQPTKASFAVELLDKPATPDAQPCRLKWSMNETTLHASMKLLEDAFSYANQRTLRFADGPDEVHRNALAKLELAKHAVKMP